MGKIKQGILGGFSGKVANVVGSSWKGIAVMKALPLSVANPRTTAQVAQRELFANVTVFAASILSRIIKPLWDRFASQMSGYNSFVQSNIELFTSEYPDPPADLIISRGKMSAMEILDTTVTESDATVTIDWEYDSLSGYQGATDLVYCLVLNRTQGTIGTSSGLVVRSVKSVDVTMPQDGQASDVFDMYLTFIRSDGTVVSDSSYKTATIPA